MQKLLSLTLSSWATCYAGCIKCLLLIFFIEIYVYFSPFVSVPRSDSCLILTEPMINKSLQLNYHLILFSHMLMIVLFFSWRSAIGRSKSQVPFSQLDGPMQFMDLFALLIGWLCWEITIISNYYYFKKNLIQVIIYFKLI